jgi:hypothetical protein
MGALPLAMENVERPLNKVEKRLLTERIERLRRRRASVLRRIAMAVGIVVGGLWAATLAFSDAPWPVVSGFWIVVGVGIGFWVFRNESASLAFAKANIESALRYDHVSVVDVRASELVEIEEQEDEGACWLFQLKEEILVLSGQEYYETARFPNDDFSLIEIRREDGRMLERLIESRGKKLTPARRLPASTRSTLPVMTTDMTIIKGSIGNLVGPLP